MTSAALEASMIAAVGARTEFDLFLFLYFLSRSMTGTTLFVRCQNYRTFVSSQERSYFRATFTHSLADLAIERLATSRPAFPATFICLGDQRVVIENDTRPSASDFVCVPSHQQLS